MTVKNNQIGILCALILGILGFSSCQKSQLTTTEPSVLNADDQVGESRLLPYEKNLMFNEAGYNQFKTDLANPAIAPLVRKLFEDSANVALTHKALAYRNIYDSRSKAEPAAIADANRVVALALQSFATSDSIARQIYINKATEILKTWANVNVSSWHRPVETAFWGMYEGYSLLKPVMSLTDRDTIDRWIRRRATTDEGKFTVQAGASVNKDNNWEAQRLSFLIYSGYILNDLSLITQAKNEYNIFLEKYLSPGDGKTRDFQDRNALVYHGYGLYSVVPFLKAIRDQEGESMMATFLNKTTSKGLKLVNAIRFWEPYLCGLYHDEFKHSIFADERNGSRRGRYNPAARVRYLDKLLGLFPERIYPYISLLDSNSSRYYTLNRYLALLGKAMPAKDIPTVEFFKHTNYYGSIALLGIGGYSPMQMPSIKILDNDISSLKVPANRTVLLYPHDFRDSITAGGVPKEIKNNTSSLSSLSFNDSTSSFIIINR